MSRVSSVLAGYRAPREHEPAMRIAEHRARERAMLERKARKDEDDLRAAMLYTHQDERTDRTARPERTDRKDRKDRKDSG